KRNKEFYPVHFKIDVIQYRLRTGDTLQATALKYGINEPSTIANWIDEWDRKGIEGLSNKKEKPTMSKKKEFTREEELEMENELLRAENAYLKKLKALGIDIPSRLRKQNHESSRNS